MLRKIIFICDRRDGKGEVKRTKFPFLRQLNANEICFVGAGQIRLVYNPSIKQMKFQTTPQKYKHLMKKFANALDFPSDFLIECSTDPDGTPKFAVPINDDADRVFGGDFGPQLFIEIDFAMFNESVH